VRGRRKKLIHGVGISSCFAAITMSIGPGKNYGTREKEGHVRGGVGVVCQNRLPKGQNRSKEGSILT